jgi:heat shock protein HtpX
MPLSHRLRNGLHSALMFGGLLGLLALLAALLGGPQLMPGIVFGGLILLVGASRVSPRWILRLYGARRMQPIDAPGLFHLRDELAERAGLEHVPEIYYIPTPVLNAFSVGRRRDAAIGLSDGLLHKLSSRELACVLAHELSHIRHNDVWVMTLADILGQITRTLSLLGQILLLLNLPLLLLDEAHVPWPAILLLLAAPWLSILLQLGLSRSREFSADLGAVELTADPEGLAQALTRLETQQPAPPGRRARMRSEPSLLRSHPVTEQRIARLRELAHSAPYDGPHPPQSLHPGWPRAEHRPRRRWLSGFWH